MKRFKNIVITGASSGIGEALALGYAAPGITLALGGRDGPRLQAVADACCRKGAVVEMVHIDVVNREALSAWLIAFDDAHPIDLLIANAGISIDIDNAGLGDAVGTHRTMAVNVGGVFNTVEPLIGRFTTRRYGQVALMSSLAAFVGLPYAASYNASKAAVRVWGESLRYQLRKHDVGVSVICPGFVESRITARWPFPMPFLMPAEDAAIAIRRGIARNQARITFPLWTAAAVWFFGILPAGWAARLIPLVTR